jgi:hypothetical protein
VRPSFDSAKSAPLTAFPTLGLQFPPIPLSGSCSLPPCRTVPTIVIFNAPFPAHTPDSPSDPWQPRATIAFLLWRLNRSWLSAAPGRATFLLFFVRLTQLPPRYPSYFYFWSVVRIFSRLLTHDAQTPPLYCLIPCAPISARQRMISFIFPRGDIDVRSRCVRSDFIRCT